MSDTEFDVVTAAYLIPDLAQQDGRGAKKLKSALADAQAGLGG